MADGGPFGYRAKQGYYADSETGLVALAYRYYEPGRGRFVNRDPVGYRGGIGLYGYVENRPAGRLDATGLQYGDYIDPVTGQPYSGLPPIGDEAFPWPPPYTDSPAGPAFDLPPFGDMFEAILRCNTYCVSRWSCWVAGAIGAVVGGATGGPGGAVAWGVGAWDTHYGACMADCLQDDGPPQPGPRMSTPAGRG